MAHFGSGVSIKETIAFVLRNMFVIGVTIATGSFIVKLSCEFKASSYETGFLAGMFVVPVISVFQDIFSNSIKSNQPEENCNPKFTCDMNVIEIKPHEKVEKYFFVKRKELQENFFITLHEKDNELKSRMFDVMLA